MCYIQTSCAGGQEVPCECACTQAYVCVCVCTCQQGPIYKRLITFYAHVLLGARVSQAKKKKGTHLKVLPDFFNIDFNLDGCEECCKHHCFHLDETVSQPPGGVFSL